ncbi:MAG: LCP family protein [Actinomycetota bacterium]|nr:LCP family protein [Actinomycetota bacterium]
MRTTLKRGIGRGAAANGNGRAVLPPLVSPPMTLYRQPERVRRSGWRLAGTIALWFLFAVLVVGSGLLGGAYLYFHEKVSDIQARTPEVKIAAERLDVVLPGKPAIALVIGFDKRMGKEKDLKPLSDTIMLLRADPETNSISMLSFPRDLYVEIRCPGRPPFMNRINQAFGECGPTGTIDTVRKLTGLPINYLITVNFRGFKQVINSVGGVWVDVDRRYFNDNRGRITGVNTYATIDLQPGYQRLNGSDALDFVRYRHTDTDFHRIARQQLFVKSFKAQIATSVSAFDLPGIIDAITSNVEIGRAEGKAISGKTILSYALFAHGLPEGHFFQVSIEGLEGLAELHTAPENIQNAVRDFTVPDVEAPEKAAAVALGRRLPQKGPRPQNVPLSVLNGNGVDGSATDASYLLAQRGYPIVTGETRNAPSFGYFRTKVYFDPDQRRSRVAANAVRALFGSADVEPVPLDIAPLSNGAMVTVIVGETFRGTLAPKPVDRTPKKQKPDVAVNPGATESLLRSVRHRVPFTLMVPRLLERTSSPDPEKPIRVYAIKKGHRAVRLTFRYGNGYNEYWGIEQTDWEDAPILQSPTTKQRIGGRLYELHYSGTRLHMVVLREGGATYWVVNTLLDKLSNDTMLAIAKGLRPLPR